MEDLQDVKEIIKLEKKLRQETGGQDYVETLRRQSVLELEATLKDLSKYRQAIISTKVTDPHLKEAKKKASGLALPYTHSLTNNARKARFIGLLLQEAEGFDPTTNIAEEVE